MGIARGSMSERRRAHYAGAPDGLVLRRGRPIPRTRHATIYDVAERAGVSIGTVSKALNSPTRVAETTRRRVLDAVHELDYVPKETATSRARKGSGRIGVSALSRQAVRAERVEVALPVARMVASEFVQHIP